MSMYSGIGSFVKKYQEGGEAQSNGGSGLPGVRGNTSGSFGSYEEWKASLNPRALGNMSEDQLISVYNAMMNFGGSGFRGGNTSTGTTLPDYASVNDDGRVVIPPSTTNYEFIQLLNTLGYFADSDPYDYQWLLKHFAPGGDGGGDDTWLAQRYNDAEKNLDVSAIANMGFTDQNKDVFTRLFEFVNTGSQVGGFVDPASIGSVGQPGSGYDPDGTSTTEGTSNRPVFIGQPPTGGTAEQPSYSLSDILVSSSEQPNLYDRFDPYPEGGFQVTDPYSGTVTQSSPYPEAPPLPDMTPATTPADPVDGTVDSPTNTTPTVPTSGTGAPAPDLDTTGADPTGDTTDTTTSLTGYQGISALKDQDPYIFEKRGMVQGLQALTGSRKDLTAEEFQSLLGGQQGRYGEGSTLAYDPRFGVYSTISDAELQRLRETQTVPNYIDPRLMTDVERARSNQMSGGTYSRDVTDEAGNVYRIDSGRQTTRIGDTQYFVNDDGTVTAYDVKDIEYETTPGFAEGGIVDVYSGDMANLQTTGTGIESFLNPERSKATLRRNLAKLAPRPTASVMQQGIMPMAQ